MKPPTLESIQLKINSCYVQSAEIYETTKLILVDASDIKASEKMTKLALDVMDNGGELERDAALYCAEFPDEAVELQKRIATARAVLFTALNWCTYKMYPISKSSKEDLNMLMDVFKAQKPMGSC